MKQRITIDYAHFDKAGFDSKNCSLANVQLPQHKRSTKVAVYNTSGAAPVFHNQTNATDLVTFFVEFLPFVQGKELITKADDLVKDVLKDDYKPASCTICKYKKDGDIDSKQTINDVIIQKAQLFLNRKNEQAGEMGYIRIVFTLQGIGAK